MTGLAGSAANTPHSNTKSDLPERFLLIIVIIVGSLIAGFKLAGPAPDYRNYQSQYLIDSISPLSFIWQGSDPLYHTISHFAAVIGLRFEAFVAFLAVCTCTLKAISLSRTDGNRLLLLAIYSSYLFWLHDYVQIRIALALSIGLYGVYTKTKFRYLFFLIAVLIHSSLVMIIVAYILIFVGTRRPVIAVIAGILFAAALFSQDIFTQTLQRVNEYQDLTAQGKFNEINIFSLMPIVMLASLAVAMLNFRHLEGRYQELIFAAIGLVSFYALSGTPVFAFRMMELFMPFYLVLMSRLWPSSNIIKILAVIYAIIGLRAIFFSMDPLIGGNLVA